MPTSTDTHYTHFIGFDSPFAGIRLDVAHSTLGILYWCQLPVYQTYLMGQAIDEHKNIDA